jgi:hypothetical protein
MAIYHWNVVYADAHGNIVTKNCSDFYQAVHFAEDTEHQPIAIYNPFLVKEKDFKSLNEFLLSSALIP